MDSLESGESDSPHPRMAISVVSESEDRVAMAHQTEAACLLETGVVYDRRVLLTPTIGDPVFAGFKPGAFSLYFGDAPVYHFDREGRWRRAFVEGVHFLKGLDTTVQAIDRVREGPNMVLKRSTLRFAEAADLDARIRTVALDLLESIDSDRFAKLQPESKVGALPINTLRDFLERIAGWDAAAWFAQRERYLGTYGPLPFLPPDCPNPIVLQVTLGHSSGIAFGGASAAEHYVRTNAEFDQHVRAVAALFGARVDQSKAVFLAGADALLRPIDDLASCLEVIARLLPSPIGPETPRPVHSFLDQFPADLADRADFRRLRELGLVRVTLGVESGSPMVRRSFGKQWSDADLRAVTAKLKRAGVGVGLIVLVGSGGVEHSSEHLQATASLVNSLELGPGDLVSLLDANELFEANQNPSFEPLRGSSWVMQFESLKSALEPLRKIHKVKLAPFSLVKQALS